MQARVGRVLLVQRALQRRSCSDVNFGGNAQRAFAGCSQWRRCHKLSVLKPNSSSTQLQNLHARTQTTRPNCLPLVPPPHAHPLQELQTTAQQTLERIQKHPGVTGVIIAGTDGAVLKTTMSDEATAGYAARVPMLAGLARSFVRDLEPTDEVEFLRLRTARNIEVMVAPSKLC